MCIAPQKKVEAIFAGSSPLCDGCCFCRGSPLGNGGNLARRGKHPHSKRGGGGCKSAGWNAQRVFKRSNAIAHHLQSRAR